LEVDVRSRRTFLRVAVTGTAGLALAPSFAHAAGAAIETTRLGDAVAMLSGAGGNVLVVAGPDDVLMVNGGAAEHSAALLDAVARHAAGKRVGTLINTDWHPEHTGSNETLGQAGVAIVAHEHTKQYLSREMFVDWRQARYRARPRHALPSRTFRTTGSMMLGSERVDYGHLGQAHTDGDIYVFLPGANVLATGDLMHVGAYPIADYTSGGWLGGMVTAVKSMLDLTNAGTRIVPAFGPVQTRADLQAQHDMLAAMRERMVKMIRQGMGADEMLAAGVSKDFDQKWGKPDLFLSTAYRGMWLHIREIGGVV
jgi:glyoxylase-like metal-dependent hydrolase (beta-lactamase superfamily II)